MKKEIIFEDLVVFEKTTYTKRCKVVVRDKDDKDFMRHNNINIATL